MHKKLEFYLDQLRFQLRNLPEERREMEVREVRQHIEVLVADHRQAGESEEGAMMKALQQFGAAKTNGEGLRQAWQREQRFKKGWTAIAGTFLAMACLMAVFVAGNVVYVSSPITTSSGGGRTLSFDSRHQSEIQAIQQRWQMDNLAIQRMSKTDWAGVSRAQVQAMNRRQGAMAASDARWSASVEAWQHQQFVLWFVLPLSGIGFLFIATMLLIFRERSSRKARLTVSR